MAFIPIPLTAKIVVKAMLSGQQCHSIFYAKADQGEWNAASLEDLADAVIAAWQQNMLALVGANYSFESVEARDMSSSAGEVVEVAVTGQKLGTATSGGAVLPNNVNLSIKKLSTVGGRTGRGRIFWPITLSGMLDASGQTVNAAFADSVCQNLRDVKDFIETTLLGQVLVGFASLYFEGLPRIEGIFREVVDFVCPDKTLDSQRRRLPGRGN